MPYKQISTPQQTIINRDITETDRHITEITMMMINSCLDAPGTSTQRRSIISRAKSILSRKAHAHWHNRLPLDTTNSAGESLGIVLLRQAILLDLTCKNELLHLGALPDITTVQPTNNPLQIAITDALTTNDLSLLTMMVKHYELTDLIGLLLLKNTNGESPIDRVTSSHTDIQTQILDCFRDPMRDPNGLIQDMINEAVKPSTQINPSQSTLNTNTPPSGSSKETNTTSSLSPHKDRPSVKSPIETILTTHGFKHVAATVDRDTLLTRLLTPGFNENQKTLKSDIQTILSALAKIPNTTIINQADPFGRTPLHLAIIHKQANIVRLLCKHNADTNHTTKIGPPLHCAAELVDIDSANHLLEYGATIDTETDEGDTALHRAATQKKTKNKTNSSAIITWLLKHNADPTKKNKKGQTPLILATLASNIESVKALSKTSMMNAKDNKGNTALIYAAHSGNITITRHLIDLGADREIKNKRGQSAGDTRYVDTITPILTEQDMATRRQSLISRNSRSSITSDDLAELDHFLGQYRDH